MTERVKFTQVSRVICPKTGIHYLDAIDVNGIHWLAQMETDVEKWIIWRGEGGPVRERDTTSHLHAVARNTSVLNHLETPIYY